MAVARLLCVACGAEMAAFFYVAPHGADPSVPRQPRRVGGAASDHALAPAEGRVLRVAALRAIGEGRLTLGSVAQVRGTLVAVETLGVPLGPVALALSWHPDGTRGTRTRGWRAALVVRLAPVLRLAFADTAREARGASDGQLGDDASQPSARSAFASLVSHELRTPLNAANGFLEIVLDDLVGSLNARQREFLGYAQTGVMQLVGLIDDLHLLGHLDAETQSLCAEPVALPELLRAVAQTHALAATAGEVRLDVSAPAGLPLVAGDARRLRQAVADLVALALGVCARGARVRLSASHGNDTTTIVILVKTSPLRDADVAHLRALTQWTVGDPLDALRGGAMANAELRLLAAVCIARAHQGTVDVTHTGDHSIRLRLHLPCAKRCAPA